MSDETMMEQGRVEFEAPREKRPRGRPPKVALDQGGDGSAVIMDEARAETIIRRVGGYLAAGVRPVPGVNYLGLSTSIILAGGSEA